MGYRGREWIVRSRAGCLAGQRNLCFRYRRGDRGTYSIQFRRKRIRQLSRRLLISRTAVVCGNGKIIDRDLNLARVVNPARSVHAYRTLQRTADGDRPGSDGLRKGGSSKKAQAENDERHARTTHGGTSSKLLGPWA